ncbi:MAG: PTS sugar transporter subunit IIB [Anaeromicrobium sp.]|jgi:PTS system galactitol-specific IIB component|uniref:PTS sugar transporter subunit IIB n=1 Tax=Anaeromicrobium sp. TaxID=1929132 RepID=UPI0025DFEECE|nr:PTS sugar transporter subunit IIB [Anaeromicrobium sp.]MCT4593920.1 PTS sugar transporter subunit IIB [Anaeromicrobium sp.]
MKNILVVCGFGVATSTMALKKIEEELKNRNMRNVIIKQCNIAELKEKYYKYDLIVAMTNVNLELNIPIVSGIPFLLEKGKKEAIEKIINIIKN